MDYLVKHNIIKKNKIIIDIGNKYIKILSVNYANKKITINGSFRFDSKLYFSNNEFSNISELVETIHDLIQKGKLPKRADISISLPSSLLYYKIIEVKNIKNNELEKYILNENTLSARVSNLTHSIDWAFLGEYEKSGETIKYCLVAAISKSLVTMIAKEFENKKLKITTISCPAYNLICLSELYFNDYDNVNKIMMDFGSASTQMAVIREGIPIYSRDIDIGFENFEKNFETAFEALYSEITKIIEFCESSGSTITKIIYTGYLPSGVMETINSRIAVDIEFFNIETVSGIKGKNYLLTVEKTLLDTTFSSCVGLSLTTFM